jgi:hypothetical protein
MGMQYHELRIVSELRKQGRHAEAEELRLRAMRRSNRRTPEYLLPSDTSPTGIPALRAADRYAAGRLPQHHVLPVDDSVAALGYMASHD